MKRFKRMLAGVMACLMVATSFNVQTMQAEAAPTGEFEEVSILTSEVTASKDESRTGEDGSYNGYIMGCTNYEGADYFKVVYTVEEGAVVTDSDQIFNFQPYNTSWGGWQSNFVKIQNSEKDESGNYVFYMAVDTVIESLGDSELLGINISYTADVSYSVQLKDLLVCTEKAGEEKPGGSASASETLIAGPFAVCTDTSMYEEGSYKGFLYSWYDFEGADQLKFTFTIDDVTALNAETDLVYVQVFNTAWGGWDTTSVKVKDVAENAGVYQASMDVEDIKAMLSSGELYGINIQYAQACTAAAVTLTGLYSVILPEAAEPAPTPTQAPAVTGTASLDYVKAMGAGWNLGNSFDGVNTSLEEEDLGETAWGNPVVVKELIQAAADKGYDSIRIPVTFYRRFDEETYKLDEEWLARVKEVIQWALEEDLYVLTNVHHDSWLWLEYWDGNTESEEYVKFTKIWEQFAEYLKDMPEQVCFETINEPVFEATGSITAQDKLDAVNLAAYNAIRSSGGNNATRMIVMPTYTHNHGDEHCDALNELMAGLNDENLIATVHYYSEWVYSSGIGKNGFDEVLWDDYTPRDSADQFFEALEKHFISKGIGVAVTEWGLLGYDSASQVNQAGEELKYYEYINCKANALDVCMMFWDNGSGIERVSGEYNWKKPLVGEMLETSMNERSAYVTGLDRVFLTEETDKDLSFPLTLNGLTFEGIEGLNEGTDYTYDADTATVTLSKAYVNGKFAEMGENYGTFAELVFTFSGGADWHEYLIKNAAAVSSETTGTVFDIKIPVDFKGSEVSRATAYMPSGKVGPNSSWWNYLQYGSAFLPDYEAGTIAILDDFWNDPTVVDGVITFHFEMYDGSVMKYTLEKSGDNVIGYPAIDAAEAVMECANEICVYVGETAIKDTYFNVPKGTSIYGTYTEPADASAYLTLNGWPATMTFGSVAQEESIKIGLMLTYMERTEYPGNITFWLKNAPVVDAVSVEEGKTAAVVVKNLAETAVVTYETADDTVASVAADGIVSGVKEGTTKVIATVTQYGRTDSFEAVVTVNHVCSFGEAWMTDADSHWHECACGEKAELAAHDVKEWTITKAPSKESKGEMAGTCSVCTMTVTKEVVADGGSGNIHVPALPDNACRGELADKLAVISKIALTEAERIAMENGADLNIILKVKNARDEVSKDMEAKFAEALKGIFAIGSYVDISLFKQVGENPETGITELNGMTKISLEIPENLRNTNHAVKRTYGILRYHDGKVDAMEAVYDAASQRMIFETDGFSVYAITYSDMSNGNASNSNNAGANSEAATPNVSVNAVPKTGDTNELVLWFTVMAMAGLGMAAFGLKTVKKQGKSKE